MPKTPAMRYVAPIGVSLAEGDVLSEIQIAKTGKWIHEYYGSVELTKQDLKDMVHNWTDGERDIVVDYQHSSLHPDPEMSKAAGWLKELKLKSAGQELWGVVEWTQKAAEYIRAKEFRYISPEFQQHYADKASGKDVGTMLLAIGLCNRPFLEGMSPVELTEGVMQVSFVRTEDGGAASGKSKGGETAMNEAIAKLCRSILELSETAEVTEDHVAQALAKLQGSVAQLTEKVTTLSEKAPAGGVKEIVVGGVKLTEESISALQVQASEGAEAMKQIKKLTAEKAVGEAISAHKITPAEKEWAEGYALVDPAGFAKMVAARPALDATLFREVGGGGSANDEQAVKAYIVELQEKGGKTLKEAQQLALHKFGAEAFNAYRLQPAA